MDGCLWPRQPAPGGTPSPQRVNFEPSHMVGEVGHASVPLQFLQQVKSARYGAPGTCLSLYHYLGLLQLRSGLLLHIVTSVGNASLQARGSMSVNAGTVLSDAGLTRCHSPVSSFHVAWEWMSCWYWSGTKASMTSWCSLISRLSPCTISSMASLSWA